MGCVMWVHIQNKVSAFVSCYFRPQYIEIYVITLFNMSFCPSDVFFRLPFMLKDGQTNGGCAQNISVWDEIGNYTFCESGNGANLTCSDRERNFRIQYETDDTSIGVIFLLQVFGKWTMAFPFTKVTVVVCRHSVHQRLSDVGTRDSDGKVVTVLAAPLQSNDAVTAVAIGTGRSPSWRIY